MSGISREAEGFQDLAFVSEKWEEASDSIDKNKDSFASLKNLDIDSEEYEAAK